MPASRSLSTLGGPPPVGNPLDADKYTRGREAAFEWIRANGFSEDSCVEIPVAWGEQDANAHVNNAVFFRWLETGRLQNLSWLGTQIPEADAQALKGNGKGKGPILARITFDYGKPVAYPDNVLIAHKCTAVGAKKFINKAVVFSYDQQCVVGTSDSVVVSYDYDHGKSTPWPTSLVDLVVKRGAERLESGAGRGEAKL
ncbi:HotDog domain-containing protein [Rhodotorula diobovata]|uniref:HotDog domain-containing protein n=1 Tax=Rhodotorula diobovata TaxID=5288 RepID=A0A5C5FVC7_9BASI|nr:HotDog domain-containing protein [Rhodotorula diobovata]